jgi:acetylglutamate kinase
VIASAPVAVRARTLAKARTLLEALPFIREHAGSTIVVKIGGAAIDDAPLSSSFAQDLALLRHVGIDVVIVHGGGPQVTSLAERLGIETTFVEGLRVTDAPTLDVATMVLAGRMNTSVVATLRAGGVRAAGLSGVDGGLVVARRRSDPDLGLVGDVLRTDAAVLRALLERGFVPVVASIAAAEDGSTLNVNADAVAAELAVGLGASKLVFVSDVPGVLAPGGELLSELSVDGALDLLAEPDAVSEGMIPKLESAVRAAKGGVRRVHLLDGRVEHALVLELFTPEGIGTMLAASGDPAPPPDPALEAAMGVRSREGSTEGSTDRGTHGA